MCCNPASPGSGVHFGFPKSLLVPGPSLGPWAPADTPGWRPGVSQGHKEPPRRQSEVSSASPPRPRLRAPSPRHRCPRPQPCAPGSFGEQPCSLLLFRFRFGARRFSLLATGYLDIHPAAPQRRARSSEVGRRRGPGRRPLGRRRGAGPDLSN